MKEPGFFTGPANETEVKIFFNEFCMKLRDILNILEEERINSAFGTPLNDFKLEVK